MKAKFKNVIVWVYLVISILFWVVFITGIESIMENNLFLLFAIIGIIDVISGKIIKIENFLKEN